MKIIYAKEKTNQNLRKNWLLILAAILVIVIALTSLSIGTRFDKSPCEHVAAKCTLTCIMSYGKIKL